MPTKAEYIYIDASGERTRFQLYVPTVTIANFGTTFGVGGALDDVRAAFNTLSLLNEVSVQALIVDHTAAPTPPANASAQREYGVKLYYVDNVNGRAGHTFLAGIDPQFLPTDSDQVDLTMTEWAALKTAIQDGMVSRDGNAITVTKGIVTGRRA